MVNPETEKRVLEFIQWLLDNSSMEARKQNHDLIKFLVLHFFK